MQEDRTPEVESTRKINNKRNSGVFAFLKWFQSTSTSRESIHSSSSTINSLSSSTESVHSAASIGTVASFSYLPPASYKAPIILEKCISAGPETDTYKARLKERDSRRESDKNITLNKKYNLFFSRGDKRKKAGEGKKTENCASLPLMTRTKPTEGEYKGGHRRTNSDSSKNRKSEAYLHVKGKRKAPQPPAILKVDDGQSRNAFSILKRNCSSNKKRLAPAPPNLQIKQNIAKNKLIVNLTGTDEIIFNDSLTLDHGILKSTNKNDVPSSSGTNIVISNNTSVHSLNATNMPKSPTPWYKRNSISNNIFAMNSSGETSNKKPAEENKYELIEKFQNNKKDQKSAIGLSYLANISQLDKEAAEILSKREQLKSGEEFVCLNNVNVNHSQKVQMQTKRKSARDLIAKFNAITNVKNSKENGQPNANKWDNFKRNVSLNSDELANNTTSDKKEPQTNKNPLMKSESACNVECKSEPPAKPNLNRKAAWVCQNCTLENDYWRIICCKCSTIKSYFDHFDGVSSAADSTQIGQSVLKLGAISKNTNSDAPISMNALERSKTQIGFSVLTQYNRNGTANNGSTSSSTPTGRDKKDERERLKKMLIEMKNSLPKRRNVAVGSASRRSVIEENVELAAEGDQLKLGAETKRARERKESQPETQQTAELIIVTSKTVYENIKVKIPSANKPLKVSSSAQTNAVVRKPLPTSLQALIPSTTDSITKSNYELLTKTAPDITSITSTEHIYNNTKPTASTKDFFIRLPKRDVKSLAAQDGAAANPADTLEINRLLRRLETAIARGDLTQAAEHAKDLAHLKVNCSVIRQKGVQNGEVTCSGKGKGFTIDMFVEDRLSHRGPFPIQVQADFTVLMLKELVAKDFEIPVDVQKWILGKELAVNDCDTLQDYGVANGCAVFLYLVASASNTDGNSNRNIDSSNKDTCEQNKDTKVERKEIVTVPLIDHKNQTIPDSKLQHSNNNLSEELKTNQIQSRPSVSHTTKNTATSSTSLEVIISESKRLNKIVENDAKLNQEKPTVKVVEKLLPVEGESSTVENIQAEVKSVIKLTEWACQICTLLNPMRTNICGVCANIRPGGRAPAKRAGRDRYVVGAKRHYQELVNLDNADLVTNNAPFECLICLQGIKNGGGVILRECLHQFCRICLANTVEYCEEAEVKCPFRDEKYACDMALQTREIKALVTKPMYDKFLARSVKQAENKSKKSFHCKTPDCEGWCLYEDNVNQFRCPVCGKVNCLTCQALHEGIDCRKYQDGLLTASVDNEETSRTRAMLEDMVRAGEALHCPACRVVLMKKWGCDWVRCTVCKTEICWVTKGARWGPAGKGDTTGGCKCGVNGVKCHPHCSYCH